ncbi:MAG: DUF1573 domain-containing protein [Planctomycetota bacterium]
MLQSRMFARRELVTAFAVMALTALYASTASAQEHNEHDGHNHGPTIIPGAPIPTTQTAKPGQPAAGAQPAPQGTVQLKPGEIPKIEFDTPTYDFGKMRTGKDVEHDFWFHNSGNGPLEIIQVKPS